MNRAPKIAKDKAALRKRVARFFEYGNSNRNEVRGLVEALISGYPVYVFGGMIRDICLEGIQGFKSDIDLVFDSSKKELEKIIAKYSIDNITPNKFGGYRIRKNSWDVDIWCLEDTWAFREGFVKNDNIESLFETTLLTWDAAIYDIEARKLSVSPMFFEHLLKGKVDVVLSQNPNEIGATVRILRAIYAKNARIIGLNAANVLMKNFERFGDLDILEQEKSSYSNLVLTISKIQKIKSLLRHFDQENELFLPTDQQYFLDI
tara:strand:+ start:1764 stop:2549 length:786 start_codon:yes stop_codon:yes gene_type:complete